MKNYFQTKSEKFQKCLNEIPMEEFNLRSQAICLGDNMLLVLLESKYYL